MKNIEIINKIINNITLIDKLLFIANSDVMINTPELPKSIKNHILVGL